MLAIGVVLYTIRRKVRKRGACTRMLALVTVLLGFSSALLLSRTCPQVLKMRSKLGTTAPIMSGSRRCVRCCGTRTASKSVHIRLNTWPSSACGTKLLQFVGSDGMGDLGGGNTVRACSPSRTPLL